LKFFKFFQYAYLAVAIFFIIEGVREWNTSREQAFLYLFFAAVAVFMFFFKRHFRNKYNNKS